MLGSCNLDCESVESESAELEAKAESMGKLKALERKSQKAEIGKAACVREGKHTSR